ncbi:LacI family transcriptional regulator [Pullulanibacillus camelliae]|uniref:LacI family transcriptional regulator n=1 Tax=Pullulanibacillus camelliae TaxID=1707096 RepID=A0A8J2VKS2_9BACL|nr:LacI family DNA-binding transcriptional regulator [Pullulanibacillus camelliae]GGE28824.1 LacI family transcriptional regulator [Pullulanibacillus camelliae]
MKKQEINSTKIAQLAGVSRSTVSRVINNYPSVPPSTREKVMKVIREYNYFPNMSAQVLAGKKMRTIGLFMIEKGHVSSDATSNMLLASVIETASSKDYYVLTHIIRDSRDPESINGVKEIFYQGRIDAGIFIGADNHEPFIEELIGEGFIVGIVDQHLPGRHEANRIVYSFDNEKGVMQAVDYLVGLNHKNIGMINGDMKRFAGPAKYEGFVKAMSHHGLPLHEEWILPGDFNRRSGYAAIQGLVQSGVKLPTAIIAANDSVAFGAMKALGEHGVAIPEDMSIIGFDDHVLSSYSQPKLTTFKVDFGYMMSGLTLEIIKAIENHHDHHVNVTIPMELVVRDSCKKI